MAKRASSDKALRPDEDKLKIRTVVGDQATLERNATFDEAPPSDHKLTTCYNRACSDYRVERRDGRACSCKRKTIEAK